MQSISPHLGQAHGKLAVSTKCRIALCLSEHGFLFAAFAHRDDHSVIIITASSQCLLRCCRLALHCTPFCILFGSLPAGRTTDDLA